MGHQPALAYDAECVRSWKAPGSILLWLVKYTTEEYLEVFCMFVVSLLKVNSLQSQIWQLE